mmetsp:Transcript_18603/g.70378  ORF Transcript_18603/g.70378 Transcript_18603/m.70378 type:complete len:84 (+) Transcript_18603:249-500(+)
MECSESKPLGDVDSAAKLVSNTFLAVASQVNPSEVKLLSDVWRTCLHLCRKGQSKYRARDGSRPKEQRRSAPRPLHRTAWNDA